MSKTLRLILGDQLHAGHSWFTTVSDNITYLLLEMRQETDYVTHHIQKVIAFFSAMRAFAEQLAKAGHRVIYLGLDDVRNSQELKTNIKNLIQREGFTDFAYILPDEYRLDQQLLALSKSLDIPVHQVDSEHFLTRRDDLSTFFADKEYLLESYYRHVRRENGWLLDGEGKPEGGKWNYDAENRKPLPPNHKVSKPLLFNHDVSELVRLLETAGVRTFGQIDPHHFIWPRDRQECWQLVHHFLEHCLVDYGRYQDAMHSEHWSLYHARISFGLNTKMLTPQEVIDAAIARYRDDPQRVPLAAIEGFIRQIAGWREFVRGVYWAQMPRYKTLNSLGNQAKLPAFYWTGDTRMSCVGHAVGQSLTYGYAHHIQRLMVTGNFALLAGVHPDEVDAWYLGVYIDAIEWVELPNTRGMSQFADGGLIATKPYISSANYINKMSNYCARCHYDHRQRIGDTACPFNALYWHFLLCHEQLLTTNHRMRMMYATLHKMKKGEHAQLRKQAERILANTDNL